MIFGYSNDDIILVLGGVAAVAVVYLVTVSIMWLFKKFKGRTVKVTEEKKVVLPPAKPEEEKSEEIKEVNMLTIRGRTSFVYWGNKLKEIMSPDKTILINMQLENNFHKTFLTKLSKSSFKFDGGVYVCDQDYIYYNMSARMYCYDFHAGLSIPVKRMIPLADLKKGTAAAKITEQIQYSLSPSNLDRYVKSKIIEGIMKGAALDEFMRRLFLVAIVGLIIAAIHLGLFVNGTGMLKNINIPGL